MQETNKSSLLKDIKISDVIQNYLPINKKGNNFLATCPFHDDKHPSLVINDKKGIFKCFVCGTSGNAISFISKYLNVSHSKAIVECSKILNIDLKKIGFNEYLNNNYAEIDKLYEINEKVNKLFQHFLLNNPIALDYLKSRSLNEDDIKRFDIGFAPNDHTSLVELFKSQFPNINLNYLEELNIIKKNYDGLITSFFKNRITFAIRNIENEIVGFSARTIDINEENKYINSPESSIFKKQEVLYNLNRIKQQKETISDLYIVEGFMDVIAMNKLNINNTVATMGIAFSYKHLDVLNNHLKSLKIINLCFDNDQAGKKAIDTTANIIKNNYYIYVVNYQNFLYKDIDEGFKSNPSLTLETVKNLIDYPSYKVNEIINTIDFNNSPQKMIGFENCCDILKTFRNDLTIEQNIDLITEKFQVEKQIIDNKIRKSYYQKSSYSNSSKKSFTNIEFTNNKINYKIISSVQKIINIENYLIKTFLYNRCFLKEFISKFSNMKYKQNNEILNELDLFYAQHPDIYDLRDIEINNFVGLLNLSPESKKNLIDLYISLNQDEINQQQFNLSIESYKRILINEKKQEIKEKNTDDSINQIINLNKQYSK